MATSIGAAQIGGWDVGASQSQRAEYSLGSIGMQGSATMTGEMTALSSSLIIFKLSAAMEGAGFLTVDFSGSDPYTPPDYYAVGIYEPGDAFGGLRAKIIAAGLRECPGLFPGLYKPRDSFGGFTVKDFLSSVPVPGEPGEVPPQVDVELPEGLLHELTPPVGYLWADACACLNDQKHVVVLWEGSPSHALCLYDVSASSTPVWVQLLPGSSSQSDNIWVARDAPIFLVLHENSATGKDQWSKYNLAGQIWLTERYETGGNFRWAAGISANGSRCVLVGTDSLDDNGLEIIILDGPDASPTTKQAFATSWGSMTTGALSANGAVFVGGGTLPNTYEVRALNSDTELTSGVGWAEFDQSYEVGLYSEMADDGLSFIYNGGGTPVPGTGGDIVLVQRLVGVWTETRFPLPLDWWCESVAISGDGSKAAYVQFDGSGFTPEVVVIDCATRAVALDGATPLVYPLNGVVPSSNSAFRVLSMSQDGSRFLVIRRTNSNQATAWIGSTTEYLLDPLYTAPATGYSTRTSAMALDGGLVVVGSDKAPTYTATVWNLPT